MSKPIYASVVIGLGQIGLQYDLHSPLQKKHCLSHTKAYLTHTNFELLGGIDPDLNNRNSFEQFSKKPSFENIETFLESNQPDIISICVPTKYHLNILDKVAPFKPKLILLEKPIASNLEELTKVEELVNKYDLKIMVNYFRRYLPFVKKIKEAINNNEYGPLQNGHVYYVKGLFNNASHYINILLIIN